MIDNRNKKESMKKYLSNSVSPLIPSICDSLYSSKCADIGLKFDFEINLSDSVKSFQPNSSFVLEYT